MPLAAAVSSASLWLQKQIDSLRPLCFFILFTGLVIANSYENISSTFKMKHNGKKQQNLRPKTG